MAPPASVPAVPSPPSSVSTPPPLPPPTELPSPASSPPVPSVSSPSEPQEQAKAACAASNNVPIHATKSLWGKRETEIGRSVSEAEAARRESGKVAERRIPETDAGRRASVAKANDEGRPTRTNDASKNGPKRIALIACIRVGVCAEDNRLGPQQSRSRKQKSTTWRSSALGGRYEEMIPGDPPVLSTRHGGRPETRSGIMATAPVPLV
ncbi:hypothetical protein F53441_3836 [Fusarium austroafricanum]|uniref:Uncharacterized protein n=1 Tax=Fusarium austroafricanum TaxID=2364996 RepID=A0A8H4KLJ9_9HYPO|nr:hypothetical protein F53441_3836 [Fusarium austroafricanum]